MGHITYLSHPKLIVNHFLNNVKAMSQHLILRLQFFDYLGDFLVLLGVQLGEQELALVCLGDQRLIERIIGARVGHPHLEDIVDLARKAVRLQHFGPFANRLQELFLPARLVGRCPDQHEETGLESKRLGIQLRVNGIEPVALSLDNFYVDRESTPRDADGKLEIKYGI